MNDFEHKPCNHVRRFVESQAHGKPRRWYNFFGWLHVKNCPQCQKALGRLTAYFNLMKSNSFPVADIDEKQLMANLRTEFRDQ